MDFSDTPEEAAFRAEARAWIQANAPKASGGGTIRDEDAVARAKKWQATKAKDDDLAKQLETEIKQARDEQRLLAQAAKRSTEFRVFRQLCV